MVAATLEAAVVELGAWGDQDEWMLDFSQTSEENSFEAQASVGQLAELNDEISSWVGTDDEGPEATFDVLYLVGQLEGQSTPTRLEIHNFSYLACLMSVFRGQPASKWGYTFSAVPPTLPYSPSIEAAIASLEAAQLVISTAQGDTFEGHGDSDMPELSHYGTTADGREELALLAGLKSFGGRQAYLAAACATAVLLSLPAVVNSMSMEPELLQATKVESSRLLLRGPARGPLYDQFAMLQEVLGPDHKDLIVPASLYLRFLNLEAKAGMGMAND